ncbi:MAG TPA: DUF3352 domain-containing protein [Conexibacter sp.]|nr:DUF3352 domain-containing protein [Conexibacter sp.]
MAGRLPHGFRALAALVALLAALAAASCGGSGTSSTSAGPDPATVTPLDAAVYAQAIVRPSGEMKAGVVAAARKVALVQDPGAALRGLLDRDRSNGVIFSRDIEPWLGRRIGVFLLLNPADSRHPDVALAAAIADRGAFASAYARMRKRDVHPAGTYRGIAYVQEGGDRTSYAAPVGDFLVLGTLRGLRAAIDASKGSSLAGAARFRDAAGLVPGDALAFVYADPTTLVSELGSLRNASPATRRALARYAGAGPVVASLSATAGRIAIDASGDVPHGAVPTGGGGQVSLGQLPGDAWLALATPPLGPVVKATLQGAGVHDGVAAQVRRRLGLDLDRDLLDPLGGLALFVRGSSLLDMGGGLLLRMTSATAAEQLTTRVEAVVAGGLHLAPHPFAAAGTRGFDVLLPQVPQPVAVLTKGDEVAAGYGAASAQDLIAPRRRLDGSAAGKAAIATLGDGYTPSFVLVVPPLVALLRSLDALQIANLSSVTPYLSAYRSLALGTKRDGDRIAVRIVAALR